MTTTNFPNGVTSYGVPVIPQGISFSKNSKVFFVAPNGGGNGTSVNQPVPTIQGAIDLCRSGFGDVIFVAPGTYAENLTIVGKDYISIIGCVTPGYARPDVVPAAGIALSCTTSQGLVLQHMRFASSDSDSVVNEGNGFQFVDCVFDGDSGQSATETNLRLVGNSADDSYTASEGLIQDCLFRNSNGSGLTFQHAATPSGVGTTDNRIINCRFYGNAQKDIISAANTSGGGAGIVLTTEINGCQFLTKNKAVYMTLNTVSFAGGDAALNSGLISGNSFANTASLNNTKIAIGGTALVFTGNFDAVGVTNGSAF